MMNPEFVAGKNVSNQQSAFLKGAGKTGSDCIHLAALE
jgi:hypothetical protein